MSTTNTSPNMSLPVPAVGVDPGPQWATDINSCLSIIDAHDHTAGHGISITPAGLNINTSLSFANQQAINLQAAVFQAQSSLATLLSVYTIGADLYFNDGNGNVVRITQSGGVTGATGTITGLPSGTAGAAYAAGTFTFSSASLTAANIDAGSYILRNNTASSKGLTLNPPNAMGANYSLTLPALPASTSYLKIDTSGNILSDVVVPSVGSNGQFYRQSLSNPVWQNLYANTQTKTANYTATTLDDIIFCSSSAFTVTLYTAVGNTGREIIVKKTDSSLANIITVAAAGGQTIDGAASYLLYTLNESITLISNGANWVIVDHICNTPWTAYSASLTGTTSNPTKGTTTVDQAYWRRLGQDVEILYNYHQTAAGSTGTGALLCSLPSGITADTSLVPVSDVTISPTPSVFSVGAFVTQSTSASVGELAAVTVLASSTTLGMVRQQTSGGNVVQSFQRYLANDTQGSFNNTDFNFQIKAKFPVASWNP